MFLFNCVILKNNCKIAGTKLNFLTYKINKEYSILNRLFLLLIIISLNLLTIYRKGFKCYQKI